MDKERIREVLLEVRRGEMDIEEAMMRLRLLPFEDLEFVKIDHHRSLRNGYPEVIYCEGKDKEQILIIMKKMMERECNVLATRASEEVFEFIKREIPEAVYNKRARMIFVKNSEPKRKKGIILVVTGGTSDIPVAEEAAFTAECMGNNVERLYDVGVAGIHRLFAHKEILFRARVIIAVAGMEGALASVIAGLVDKPVIAVPTSIGYGANFKGLSALLTMLNSCAAGISVVNIDNGFGAGFLASMINALGEGE